MRYYTKEEDEIIKKYRDTHTFKELATMLNRSVWSVQRRAGRIGSLQSPTLYRLYLNDKYLMTGTVAECAARADRSETHIRCLATPSRKKRQANRKGKGDQFYFQVERVD